MVDEARGWLERLFNNPSAVMTLLLAVAAQGIAAWYFQVTNNQEQAAEIALLKNNLAVISAEHRNMEGRLVASDLATSTRISELDRTGTRAMEVVVDNQRRNTTAIDKLMDRMNTIDTRINNIALQTSGQMQGQIDVINVSIKQLTEQAGRMIQAIDNTYNLLNEHMRTGDTKKPSGIRP